MVSLSPLRNESAFKCPDAYRASIGEYFLQLKEKCGFDELISEGAKIWRGQAEYQARSRQFRSQMLKVIVTGTVLSMVSDDFQERLLGWPIEGRGKRSVKSRPSTLVARRIMHGAIKQTLQNYADAADEIIARGIPVDELGRDGCDDLVALAQAFRKRTRQSNTTASPVRLPASGVEPHQAVAGLQSEQCALGDAAPTGLAEVSVIDHAISLPVQTNEPRAVVLTLDDASHKKFLECSRTNGILMLLVRPESDHTAIGKLLINNTTVSKLVHTRVKKSVRS